MLQCSPIKCTVFTHRPSSNDMLHCVSCDWILQTGLLLPLWCSLRFMVDIITLGIARNSSDWLHTVQGFVCYATRIRRNQPSWLVRSLPSRVPVSFRSLSSSISPIVPAPLPAYRRAVALHVTILLVSHRSYPSSPPSSWICLRQAVLAKKKQWTVSDREIDFNLRLMSCAMCWISIIIDQVALELERKSTPTYAVKTLFYYSSNGGIRLYMDDW